MGAKVVQIFDAGGDYDEQIHRASTVLKSGGIVVLPTETVYGAAAVLNQPKGLLNLRALPPQATPKPLTIHLAHRDDAKQYLGPTNDLAQRMMKKLWPGPVALMFDVPQQRREEAAREIGVPVTELYDGQSITLRCPDHVVGADVLAQINAPVILRKSGDSSARVPEEWLSKIDLILDAGPTRYSKPSTIVKVKEDGYDIVRAGIYDQRIIERLLRTTILFVCSGNTCRSPMAEALTRQILAKKLGITEAELEKKGLTVLSAGSFAMPGAKAATPAIEALKALGADLSRHRSRPLSVELVHQADVIYAMSRNHAQQIVGLVPSAAEKVVTLDPDQDIDDPIGGDLVLYQTLAGQLQTLIEHRLEERSLP